MQIIKCCDEQTRSTPNMLTKKICSRHKLVFGEETQRNISDLVIGVNSTGGLGFILLELLMKLFPKKLIYIDKDHVELTNLNRLVGATPIDARRNARKVDVASRNILSFNPNQQISALHGDFLKKENQRQFKKCDIIFGASDSNAVRIASNRLCLAHGIPYIDCGTGALVTDGVLRAAGGQVIIVLPGSCYCLHCSDMFNVENAMKEFLPNDEKKRQEEQGYIKGVQIAAPQVYSLNMMVASVAVWTFQRMVSGENLDFDGISINAKDFQSCPWKEPKKEINFCPTCGVNGILMQGDEVDLLCREEKEAEFDVQDIKDSNHLENKFSNKSTEQLEREFHVDYYPRLILGKDESSPINLGLWTL